MTNTLTFYRTRSYSDPSPWGYCWRLVAPNGEKIAAATQGYSEARGARENAAQVLGAGILAGHHVIPDTDDGAAVMAAIETRYGKSPSSVLRDAANAWAESDWLIARADAAEGGVL